MNSDDDPEARLRTFLADHDLAPTDRLPGGSRSQVLSARTTDGREVVVKAPPTRSEAAAEANALQIWRASGSAVRLLDYEDQTGVLVLEKLEPGEPLPSRHPSSVDIAADLLERLHRSDPGRRPLGRLETHYPAAESQARQDNAYERRARQDPLLGEAGLHLLTAAANTVAALSRTVATPVLLHGDFSSKNILSAGSGYVIIDPIPKLGDPCSDVASFAAAQPADQIFDTAFQLGDLLGLDRDPIARWSAVYVVLQNCQAWRNDQAELDALLRDPTFQDHLL